ncbi:MAG: YdjY domain-containing protein [Candidatus Binatia bacterium]
MATPVVDEPLETNLATKEVKVFGIIYPTRFNSAQGEEARYHLLVWKGGVSTNALIETPVDDLKFHDALVSLGAHPGDNLTMASWNKRHDPNHPASRKKVAGSPLNVRLSWEDKPLGISIEQAFRVLQGQVNDSLRPSLVPSPEWRFGGNRDRLFNKIPFAPRPGCLACLYSCPSGKVSNGALSVHDYVETPSRFTVNTDILPPDGTPVIVTFSLVQ